MEAMRGMRGADMDIVRVASIKIPIADALRKGPGFFTASTPARFVSRCSSSLQCGWLWSGNRRAQSLFAAWAKAE